MARFLILRCRSSQKSLNDGVCQWLILMPPLRMTVMTSKRLQSVDDGCPADVKLLVTRIRSRCSPQGRTAWVWLWLMAGAWVPLQSQPPTSNPDPIAARVDALVRELDRGNVRQRDQAESDLMKLGPAVLTLLPAIEKQLPPDLQIRLKRIVKKLEQAELESVWRSSTVTIDGTYPLKEITQMIHQQTGNRLVVPDQLNPSIAVRLSDAPFWVGLDRLLDDFKMSVNIYAAQPGSLGLNAPSDPAERKVVPTAYAGPLRVQATRVTATQDLRFPGASNTGLHLEVVWEPRLSPIAVSCPLSKFVAIDSDGNRYTADSGVKTFPVRPGMSAVELKVPFSVVPRSVSRWEQVRGVCEVLVPGKTAEFAFSDLSKAETRKRGQVAVTFEGARRNEGLWELRIFVAFDQAESALDSHRGWILNNPAYLENPQGKKLDPVGVHTTRQGRRSVGLAFLFDSVESLEKHRFVYQTPAGILRRSLEFELSKVILP